MWRRRKGFTLIVLLVIISIIALLMAINMRRVCINRHANFSRNFLFLDYTVKSVYFKDLRDENVVWHRSWRSEIARAGEPVWPKWLQH